MAVFHRVINAPDASAIPLLDATIKGDLDKVKDLLGDGADVNEKDEYEWTALHLAAAYGHGEVVGWLLRSGADPNLRNTQGRSALMYAAAFGHSSIVSGLLNTGSDVNATSSDPDELHNCVDARSLVRLRSNYQAPARSRCRCKRQGRSFRRYCITFGTVRRSRGCGRGVVGSSGDKSQRNG